jgi:hypothetical protein
LCDVRGEHALMFLKSARRGIWVPRSCTIPIVILGLIVFAFDRCSRH